MYRNSWSNKGQNSRLSGHTELFEHNLVHTFNEPMKGSFIHGYSMCLCSIDA